MILFGSPKVALFSEGLTPVFEDSGLGAGPGRLETDCFGVILYRAFKIAFCITGFTPVIEVKGFGLNANRLVAVLYRAI